MKLFKGYGNRWIEKQIQDGFPDYARFVSVSTIDPDMVSGYGQPGLAELS